MLGIRLITTGLKEDIHSVIGFEIHRENSVEKFLIQPKEVTCFDYDAMKEINNISIPELKQVGKDRQDTLRQLLELVETTEETIVVWYLPFIYAFLSAALSEVEYEDFKFIALDLLDVAKLKKFNKHSFNFGDVCVALGCEENLVTLFGKLVVLQDIEKVRRI